MEFEPEMIKRPRFLIPERLCGEERYVWLQPVIVNEEIELIFAGMGKYKSASLKLKKPERFEAMSEHIASEAFFFRNIKEHNAPLAVPVFLLGD